MDRPDSPDAELIRYRVCTSFSKVANEIAISCIPSHEIFDNAFRQLIFFLFFFFFCDVSGMTLKWFQPIWLLKFLNYLVES